MIYVEYILTLAMVIFAIWYISGMIRDLFSSKKGKKKSGCDKCDTPH